MTITTAATTPPTATFDYTSLTCPLGKCGEELLLTWRAAYTLSVGDLSDPTLPTPAGAHSEWWRVECLAGHVILLPDGLGCGCDDPEGPDCAHDQEQFDQAVETRTFRRHDADRLRDMLLSLGGAR